MFLEGNGTTGGIHTFSSHRQGKEMLATHGENKSVLVFSCFFVRFFVLFVCMLYQYLNYNFVVQNMCNKYVAQIPSDF